jgi:phage-related minor tail protein
MLKNMVMNGLLYRAQSGGTTISGAGGPTNAKEFQNTLQVSTTTAAVSSLSQRYVANTNLLTAEAPTGAAGFTDANTLISGFISTFGSALAATLLPIKTFTDTLLSAAGGAPTNIISALASIFGGRAEGGPVQGGTAYIVGERGPELFVPGVSGAIVPNDQIQPNQNKNSGTITGSSNNTYNFNINIPNANTPEVIAALRKLLSDLETNKIVSES